MSFRGSCLALLSAVLVSAPLCFVLGRGHVPRSWDWALVRVGAGVGDRAVGDLLSGAGLGGSVSESSQFVLLDDFGGLRFVPLDRYGEEGAGEGDPRDDGYAGTLRSFFVREGERYFFVPAAGKSPSPAAFRRRVAGALDMPHRVDWPGAPSAGLRFAPLSAAAVLSSAFLALVSGGLFLRRPSGRRSPHPPRRGKGGTVAFLAQLPLAGALALSGAGGFALGGMLLALGSRLFPLLREYSAQGGSGLRGLRECSGIPLLPPAVLALLAIGLVCFGGINPLAGLLGLIMAPVIPFLVLLAETAKERSGGHRRFTFLPILGSFREGAVFSSGPIRELPRREGSPALLWFFAAAAAFVLSLAAPPEGGAVFSGLGPVPGRDAWDAHAAFQASFSLRPLGRGEGPSWGSYRLGADGLIEAADPGGGDFGADLRAMAELRAGADLPWTPEDLFALEDYLRGASPRKGAGVFAEGRSLPREAAALAFAFLGFAVLAGRRRPGPPAAGDMAARARRARQIAA